MMEENVFCLLMFASMNAFVVYKQLNRNSKLTFLDFLLELAESLIARGQLKFSVRRRPTVEKRPRSFSSMEMSEHTCQ